MTTSISSEAFLNFKNDMWNMKVDVANIWKDVETDGRTFVIIELLHYKKKEPQHNCLVYRTLFRFLGISQFAKLNY